MFPRHLLHVETEPNHNATGGKVVPRDAAILNNIFYVKVAAGSLLTIALLLCRPLCG
jgi:hypothetical protein